MQRNLPSDFLLIKFVDNHDTDRASYLLSVAIDEWMKRKEEERINGTIRKSVLKGGIIVQEQANQTTNSRGQRIDPNNKGKEGELSPKHFLTDGEKERIIVHKLFSIFKVYFIYLFIYLFIYYQSVCIYDFNFFIGIMF